MPKTKSRSTTKKAGPDLMIGKAYFFRGVTMYYVGRLTTILDDRFVLADASWVADTGRFNEAMKSGNFSEVEPFANPVTIYRSALIDHTEFTGTLPLAVR